MSTPICPSKREGVVEGRREKADHLQRFELASISAPALSAENEASLQAGGKQLASDVIYKESLAIGWPESHDRTSWLQAEEACDWLPSLKEGGIPPIPWRHSDFKGKYRWRSAAIEISVPNVLKYLTATIKPRIWGKCKIHTQTMQDKNQQIFLLTTAAIKATSHVHYSAHSWQCSKTWRLQKHCSLQYT